MFSTRCFDWYQLKQDEMTSKATGE
jgi:hypothetical protein